MTLDTIERTDQGRSREDHGQNYEELGQGDHVEEGEHVAVTPKGLFKVPGNMSEGYLAEELGVDNSDVYKRQYRSEDSRTSASAIRAAEHMLNELGRFSDSPVDVLDGGVQEREGQSTDLVEDEYPWIDRV